MDSETIAVLAFAGVAFAVLMTVIVIYISGNWPGGDSGG